MNGQYASGEVVLGNWILTRMIGEGSYGRVFEAEREVFEHKYQAAIKIITIPHSQAEIKSVMADGMDNESITAYFRGFVEDLTNEFALMSNLKGNSNVVNCEDYTVIQHEEGIGWDIIIRMELLTPLIDYAQNSRLKTKDAARLGIDICKALELCQKHNIIHRDIKPENIFVSELDDFKLGDFGIARTADKTTSGLSKKGTYTYMAPEIYRGDAYGASVDIYSLGIVLYRLLNDNRVPFLPEYPKPITYSDQETARVKRFSGAALPVPRNADSRLARIILKACAYAPSDRYSSPRQMREELESTLRSREENDGTVSLFGGSAAQKAAESPVDKKAGSDSGKIEAKEDTPVDASAAAAGASGDRRRFCPRCGAGTADDEVFCERCGYKIAKQQQPPQPGQLRKPAQPETRNRRAVPEQQTFTKPGNRRTVLLLIVGILAAAAIAALVLVLLVGKADENSRHPAGGGADGTLQTDDAAPVYSSPALLTPPASSPSLTPSPPEQPEESPPEQSEEPPPEQSTEQLQPQVPSAESPPEPSGPARPPKTPFPTPTPTPTPQPQSQSQLLPQRPPKKPGEEPPEDTSEPQDSSTPEVPASTDAPAVPAVGFLPGYGGEADVNGSCYFIFTPDISGVWVMYTSNNGNDDPMLSVYDSNINLIASDDDSGDGYNAAITIDLNAGQTYYIIIEFFSGGAGSCTLSVAVI